MSDVTAYFKEAFYRYNTAASAAREPKSIIRYATRTAMLLAEYSRAHRQFTDAHLALMRAHFQVPSSKCLSRLPATSIVKMLKLKLEYLQTGEHVRPKSAMSSHPLLSCIAAHTRISLRHLLLLEHQQRLTDHWRRRTICVQRCYWSKPRCSNCIWRLPCCASLPSIQCSPDFASIPANSNVSECMHTSAIVLLASFVHVAGAALAQP